MVSTWQDGISQTGLLTQIDQPHLPFSYHHPSVFRVL
jgi:hypothetical protein